MEKIYKNREAALKAANDFLNEHPGWVMLGDGYKEVLDDFGHIDGTYPIIQVSDGVGYPEILDQWEDFCYEP